MILSEPIETPRLLLRSLDLSDVGDAYLAWMNDPEIVRFLEVRFNGVQKLSDIRGFVETMNVSPNNYMLGIFTKDGGRHIGNIKLGPIICEHARSEIGYLIGDQESWGKGYASEAISAMARFGFDQLGLKKIKAGFELEATVPLDSICDGRRVASLLFAING